MKKTKDSDIALMHLEHKVQYTGEFFIFPKDQFIPIYSMMQNSAEHVRVVGSLLSTFWISWAKSVFKLMNIFWCDFIKTWIQGRGWNCLLVSHSQITYNLSAYQKHISSFYQELTAPLLAGELLAVEVGHWLGKFWQACSGEGKLVPVPLELLRSNSLESYPSLWKFRIYPIPLFLLWSKIIVITYLLEENIHI